MLNDILDKFSSKGWALYESHGSDKVPDIILRDKTTSLGFGKLYFTLPSISQSKDIEEIKNAVRYMSANELFPIIRYNEKSIPLTVTRFDKNFVRPVYLLPVEIPYDSFLQSLDTLPVFSMD